VSNHEVAIHARPIAWLRGLVLCSEANGASGLAGIRRAEYAMVAFALKLGWSPTRLLQGQHRDAKLSALRQDEAYAARRTNAAAALTGSR